MILVGLVLVSLVKLIVVFVCLFLVNMFLFCVINGNKWLGWLKFLVLLLGLMSFLVVNVCL